MTEHASSKWVSLQYCSNLNYSSWQKWLISYSECNLLSPYFHCFTILIVFLEAYDISAFLTAYFESDDSGLSLSQSVSCFYCDWILFTGMLYTFSFILLFISWCEQHYSSAWRIHFGTSAATAISLNHLKNLSYYMLRVEWGRRWRQSLIFYWKMSQIRWPMIWRQNFIGLLLNIISVSLIVLICAWHKI